MAECDSSPTMKGEKEVEVTIVVSLLVAAVVCVALLVGFWLFTLTPFGRRFEQDEQRHRPRLG